MRPVREIDPEFFAPDEALSPNVPLLDAWLKWNVNAKPLAGKSALLVQHQLSDQVPMLAALVQLGLNPARTWWLNIRTRRRQVRDYARTCWACREFSYCGQTLAYLSPTPLGNMRGSSRPFWLCRRIRLGICWCSTTAHMYWRRSSRSAFPKAQVRGYLEQTTRGLIKIHANAMLQRASLALPLVNVAGSEPKRTLEPPFIGMAVCAALQPSLHRHFGTRSPGRCLVFGYGAIGEQVATFLRYHFDISPERIAVADPSAARTALAKQRGFNL